MEKKAKYPANLYLKDLQLKSGKTVRYLARKLGVSERVVSLTIHGHYKGMNIVPKLLEELL